MRVEEKVIRVEEIKKTVYVAEDGTTFSSEEQCKKYEESAMFIVKSKLKKLGNREFCLYDLNEECGDEELVEIFDIQTEEDLENLRRYLYLRAMENNETDKSLIESCFDGKPEDEGKRDKYLFKTVTCGHEVMVCWWYDMDGFYIVGNGTIDAYYDNFRDKMKGLIAPVEETKEQA